MTLTRDRVYMETRGLRSISIDSRACYSSGYELKHGMVLNHPDSQYHLRPYRSSSPWTNLPGKRIWLQLHRPPMHFRVQWRQPFPQNVLKLLRKRKDDSSSQLIPSCCFHCCLMLCNKNDDKTCKYVHTHSIGILPELSNPSTSCRKSSNISMERVCAYLHILLSFSIETRQRARGHIWMTRCILFLVIKLFNLYFVKTQMPTWMRSTNI